MQILHGQGQRYQIVLVNDTYAIQDTVEEMYTVSLPKRSWNIDCLVVFKETCDEWNMFDLARRKRGGAE